MHLTLSDMNIVFPALILLILKIHLHNLKIIVLFWFRCIFCKHNINIIFFFFFFLIQSELLFLFNGEFNSQKCIMYLLLVIFLFSAFVLSSSLHVLYLVLFEKHFYLLLPSLVFKNEYIMFLFILILSFKFPKIFLTYSNWEKCVLCAPI